jgi:hypothetical protein
MDNRASKRYLRYALIYNEDCTSLVYYPPYYACSAGAGLGYWNVCMTKGKQLPILNKIPTFGVSNALRI